MTFNKSILNFKFNLIWIGWVLCLGVGPLARASWEFLPESRHQLFQTYSFFIEQHNILVYRGEGRYWAAVSANLPLVGNNELSTHPQLLFHFSGNDSMHVDDEGGVFTETLDTRIGLMFEIVTPQFLGLKWSIGLFHESGHTVDGSQDPSLAPLNLGDNVLRARVLRDFGTKIRAGITYVPVIHAIPDNLNAGMNEFIEYFPWGSKEDHSASPFLAMGLANGISFTGSSTFHAQLGLSFGSHFQDRHTHDARLVVGYYNGVDPRAKYSQFDGDRGAFEYLGIMFDI